MSDVLVETPDGVTLDACPVCGSHAEIWRYSKTPDAPTETAVCCSNAMAIGPQLSSIYSGCLLYMPPNDFYRGTIREAVKFWTEYGAAVRVMRGDGTALFAKIQAQQSTELMADCMVMVREELVQAGIVDKTVPPMMVSNAVCAYIARLPKIVDDRKIADTVNELRDIAVKFHDAAQLRERIAHVVVPLLKACKKEQLHAALDTLREFQQDEYTTVKKPDDLK